MGVMMDVGVPGLSFFKGWCIKTTEQRVFPEVFFSEQTLFLEVLRHVFAVVRVTVCVSVGAGVQPWVGVGAVPVSAPQRAEDHGATCYRAAVFDL